LCAEIKVSSPGRQQQEGEEGDIAPPMVVRSRWHVDDEEEDGLIADGQASSPYALLVSPLASKSSLKKGQARLQKCQ
jgi:hypothetical protein